MKDAVDRYPIAAWKCYTQCGPEGIGFELDSPDVGIPFIERARQLGVHNICIHKGLLFPGFPEEFGRCADVGRAAALYPDVNFIAEKLKSIRSGRANRLMGKWRIRRSRPTDLRPILSMTL